MFSYLIYYLSYRIENFDTSDNDAIQQKWNDITIFSQTTDTKQ